MNWFRKDEEGKFLWPGFGENIHVMKWIVQRIHGQVSSVERPIGRVPGYEDLDWSGFEFSEEDSARITNIDSELWKQELLSHELLFSKIYDKLPKEIFFIRELLLSALWRSPREGMPEPETE